MNNNGKDITREEDNRQTSGFTTNLTDEMSDTEGMTDRNEFKNITLFYVSSSGHARLFTATRYGKRFMLKCLKSDFLFTPIYQQIQNKEFEIGVQLEHPYICHTIGLEQVDKLGRVIIMEYIDGDNLQNLMDKGMLTPSLAKKIVRQLMDALEYMHNKQIVHRDLKPSNVMVTHNGQNVKLIDFGLSDSDSFCILKTPAGTSGYIAPEQLMPNAKPEPTADIYSLGCIIDEMAKVVNSRKLKSMAAVCTIRDINKRPKSISQLRRHFRQSSYLRMVAISLAVYCLMMTAILAASYWHKHKQANAMQQEHIESNDSLRQDDNLVMDYQLWK